MKLQTDTIMRTALLLLALVNQVLVVCGKTPLPVQDEELTQALSLCLTIGTALWSWWKNNSFTAPAVEADAYLKELKKERKK